MNSPTHLIDSPASAGVVSSGFGHEVLRILALTLLISAAALYEATHLSALLNSEVWVHLRTGGWILQNRSIPHNGLFSQYSNLGWNDASWGFDLLLAVAYGAFGLKAIPILLMGLKAALAVVTFWLGRSLRADFWTAVVLSALAQYAIPVLQPIPYSFSILFFAIELQLLLRSRQTGTVRHLFWLPLLFVIWANLHLLFVAGLLLMGLFLGALFVEHGLRGLGLNWISPRILSLPLTQVSWIAFFSLLGSFVTPYTFHLLPLAFKGLYSDVAFQYFSEMSSMSFRKPQDFLLMLLVMAGFLALGRRRSLELFELTTLLLGTLVAFRIQRDGWLAVLPALAVISNGFVSEPPEDASPSRPDPFWRRACVSGLTALVLAIAAVRLPSREILMNKIGQIFPVKACDYIQQNHLSQPIFNAYPWGSFLVWYLPQYPVVVDSRVELYGDEILGKYFSIISGKELLEADPTVSRAGTLLLERKSAMAKALMNLPALRSQYQLVYSDDIASVFVPQRVNR